MPAPLPRDMLGQITLAVQFLTRLPLGGAGSYSPARWAAAPRWFALVGLGLGLAGAGLLWALAALLPQPVAVLLVLAALLGLTGALHEDGLADAADGLGGGRDTAHALAIMRDSRIGSYGVLALILTLALQAACLMLMPLPLAMAALVLAQTASRALMAGALAQGRYLRAKGAGSGLDRPLGRAGWAALGLTLLAATLLAGTLGLGLGAGLGALALGAGAGAGWLALVRRKLGGDTGDTLGAAQMISATACLIGALAWA